MRNFLLVTALAACAMPSVLTSQCRPPANSHEARLLAFFSVPVAFTANPMSIGNPASPEVSLALEGATVPVPSTDLQRTEYCYTGRAQNTSLTRYFGRPRLAISLPDGLGAEVSYLPSITVSQATPDLGSAAVWYTRDVGQNLFMTLRAHGTVGTIRGPITCPAKALQQSDPAQPCYGTAVSRDEFNPNMFGGELIAQHADPASRFAIDAGVGVNRLMPRFRVGFSDLSGGTDHTRIVVNLTRVTALAGASYRLARACSVSVNGYASFTDAVTLRGMLGCMIL